MRSANLRAALLILLAMALFAAEDMFLKLLCEDLPFAEVLGITGLIGWLAFAAGLAWQGRRLWTRDLLHPAVLARNLAEAAGSCAIVAALALGELSTTAAIMQALPLMLVLGAALVLGEPVGWRRWAAVLAGLGGVLLILRPGLAQMRPGSLLALAAVAGYAARDIATRRVPPRIHSLQLGGSAFFGLLLASGVMAVVLDQPLLPPRPDQLGLFAGCSAVGLGAYVLLIAATRQGEAGALAPFRYARLVFALVLAFVVLGERPDAATLAGAAVVVGSGSYAMWREARHRARIPHPAGRPA